MSSNVQILNKALQILADHGTTVDKISGWETRDGSKANDLVPEAVVVHHTGDVSTPINLIRDGRKNLPGPLANFLVGQSGKIYLIAAGYSNNAGYGGAANFNKAKAGKLTSEVKPAASDGSWSANGNAWAIEGDGQADWPAIVRQHVIEVAAALHIAQGWDTARVIAHKELTKRKPGDPGDDMGKVREDVLKLIAEWSDKPVEPPKLGSRILSKKAGEDIGPDVAELGKLLTSKGFDVGTPTDVYGPMMDAAVRAIQKAAGLTETGVVDPATLAAIIGDPVVIDPEPPKGHKIKVMTVNAQAKRFGGGVYVADGKFVNGIDPAVALGCEVEETARDQILKYSKLDKVYPLNYVAVFFKDAEFTYGPRMPLTFDDKGVQGAVATKLTSKVNGGSFVACSVHVRPNDAIRGTAAQKLKGKTDDVHAVIDFLAPHPDVIVGGDWSTEAARPLLRAAGYTEVTPDVATYKTFKLDSLWIKGNVKATGEGRVIKTDSSDHAATVVELSVPAQVPTN